MKLTHVVTDSRDGYTFWRDGHDNRFTLESAKLFARHRNEDRAATAPQLKVYELKEVPL